MDEKKYNIDGTDIQNYYWKYFRASLEDVDLRKQGGASLIEWNAT